MISFDLGLFGPAEILKLSVLDEQEEIAFYLFVPHSQDIYEIHTHFSPQAYGSAVEVSKSMLQHLFSSLPLLETLVTKVPVNNPLAKRLAKKCGLKLYGVLPDSFKLEDDSMIDQEMFYISRKDVLCQFS